MGKSWANRIEAVLIGARRALGKLLFILTLAVVAPSICRADYYLAIQDNLFQVSFFRTSQSSTLTSLVVTFPNRTLSGNSGGFFSTVSQDSSTGYIYFLNNQLVSANPFVIGGAFITTIDPASGAIISDIPLPSSLQAQHDPFAAFSRGTGTILLLTTTVSSGALAMVDIDPLTGAFQQLSVFPASLPLTPGSWAFDPLRALVYFTNANPLGGNDLLVVSLASPSVLNYVGTVPSQYQVTSIAVDQGTGILVGQLVDSFNQTTSDGVIFAYGGLPAGYASPFVLPLSPAPFPFPTGTSYTHGTLGEGTYNQASKAFTRLFVDYSGSAGLDIFLERFDFLAGLPGISSFYFIPGSSLTTPLPGTTSYAPVFISDF